MAEHSTPPLTDPDWLDLHAAGEILHRSTWTVRRRIAAGELPATRFGSRALLVRREDVLALAGTQ